MLKDYLARKKAINSKAGQNGTEGDRKGGLSMKPPYGAPIWPPDMESTQRAPGIAEAVICGKATSLNTLRRASNFTGLVKKASIPALRQA